LKLEVSNLYAKIDPISEKLKEQFRFYVPSARYTYLHKQYLKTKGKMGWDGKAELIRPDNTVLAGLVPRISNDYSCKNIVDVRNISTPKLNCAASLKLRDYQLTAVLTALGNTFRGTWWPRGILKVATGGGKTEMAVAMYLMHKVPTMFLVHRKDLMYQAAARFDKYGVKVGIIGDGKFEVDEPVVAATMQTIASIFRRDDDPRFRALSNKMLKVNQVFFDEAHLMASNVDKGNEFVSLASHLPNAYARWGLTATPFMRTNYDNVLLEGVTGGLLCDISNDFLIQKGYLTPPKIKIIRSEGVKIPRKTEWRDAYERSIVLNPHRARQVLDEAKKGPHPSLIFVTQKLHGEFLMEKAKQDGYPIRMKFVNGDTPVKERQEIVKLMRSGGVDTIIATTVFDEGVDIPELASVILAGGGKSQVKALQRIGRGLRLAANKKTLNVIDFYDNQHYTVLNHSKKRMEYWKSEGFDVT